MPRRLAAVTKLPDRNCFCVCFKHDLSLSNAAAALVVQSRDRHKQISEGQLTTETQMFFARKICKKVEKAMSVRKSKLIYKSQIEIHIHITQHNTHTDTRTHYVYIYIK